MKTADTIYRGYKFRSRLEARWAVFFDALGIKWEYEPEGIEFEDGSQYLPDFYLIDFHCYFEVKRRYLRDTAEGKKAIRKISTGKDEDDWAGLICFGDPMDNDLTIFCQEVDDGGGGEYEANVTFGIHPQLKTPYLFSYWDDRERTFYSQFTSDDEIPMVTKEYGKYSSKDFITPKVIWARKLARQARFEFGETPVIKVRR